MVDLPLGRAVLFFISRGDVTTSSVIHDQILVHQTGNHFPVSETRLRLGVVRRPDASFRGLPVYQQQLAPDQVHMSTLFMFMGLVQAPDVHFDPGTCAHHSLYVDLVLRNRLYLQCDSVTRLFPNLAGCSSGTFDMLGGRLDLIGSQETMDFQDLPALFKDLDVPGATSWTAGDPCSPICYGRVSFDLMLLAGVFTGHPSMYTVDDRVWDNRADAVKCLGAVGIVAAVHYESSPPLSSASIALDIIEAHTVTAMSREDEHKTEACSLGPPLLALLYPYQKHHVDWMCRQETTPHRQWVPVVRNMIWFHPPSKRFWRGSAPREVHGGFLMCEMGMGKTCTMLGLCVTRPRCEPVPCTRTWCPIQDPTEGTEGTEGTDGTSTMAPAPHVYTLRVGGTLVVTPLSILEQWHDEIKTKTPHLRVCVYHGSNRNRFRDTLHEFDMVLTTYNILAKEFQNPGHGDQVAFHARHGHVVYVPPLHNINWSRTVLDESHSLNTGTHTGMFKSCMALCSHSRWCLTGTPFTSHLDEMIPQMMFLGGSVVFTGPDHVRASWVRWRYCVRNAMCVEQVLGTLARRVTRETRVHGNRIIEIPDHFVTNEFLDLSEDTRGDYLRFLGSFEMNSVMATLRGFMSARLFLSGGAPRVGGGTHDRFACMPREDTAVQLDDPCPICYDELSVLSHVVRTPCMHHFCLRCMDRWFGTRSTSTCPNCRENISETCVYRLSDEIPPLERPTPAAHKIDALRHIMDESSPNAHILVFIHFTETRAIIEKLCDLVGFRCYHITGGMTSPARRRNLHSFSTHVGRCMFLLTTRSCSVGINLVAATDIVLFEPGLNQNMEKQAISRAVRIGQTNEVRVIRFITRDTVEQDIMNHGQVGFTAPILHEFVWGRRG